MKQTAVWGVGCVELSVKQAGVWEGSEREASERGERNITGYEPLDIDASAYRHPNPPTSFQAKMQQLKTF